MIEKKILLFGMPRSGTTWIGKILNSQPDTLYRHEPDSWGLLNDVPLLPRVDQAMQYAQTINRFIESIPRMHQTKVSATLPIFRQNYLSPSRFHLHRISNVSSLFLARFFGEISMPQFVNYKADNNLHLIWKSVESLGRLGVIARVAEDCRAVHLVRHPCGYISSVLRGERRKKFTSTLPSSEDYNLLEMLMQTEQAQAQHLTLDRLKKMTHVERLAWRWVLVNEKALDDISGAENCTTVKYENFCEDPEGSARRIFQFVGLDWHPQVEKFLLESTARDRNAYYSIFKDPIKSANKWRDELSASDISAILRIAEKSKVGRLYLEQK